MKLHVRFQMVVILLLTAAFVHGYTLGDVNNDKQVTILDALLIAQKYTGFPVEHFVTEASDVNWDDKTDMTDALLVAMDYVYALRGLSVFAFSQCDVNQEDQQLYELLPDINIRAISKWSTMGDEPSDYNFQQIENYHANNILFIGGGTASVFLDGDFGDPDIQNDFATRDANNQIVAHQEILENAFRGSIANPSYRKYLINWAKIQIDGGVDGLFFDEVNGGFSGGSIHGYNYNEGFDDYTIADFNQFLLDKYPDYTESDWQSQFAMTADNILKRNVPANDLEHNFNYRDYLQKNGWNGNGYEGSPMNPSNPLAAEWGRPVGNRLYRENTFQSKYIARYWQEIVTDLRRYTMEKYKKHIYITSNGIWPFVDFNSLGMYDWNPDEESLDGRGAKYVPVSNGHLDGSLSLMDIYKKLYYKNRETAGNKPMSLFIDWPCDMMTNYLNLPVDEKIAYWKIYGAEAYAAGLFPAFHLKETITTETATQSGVMEFFKTYKKFYKTNQDLYSNQNCFYSDETFRVSAPQTASNLIHDTKQNRSILHIINHNYKTHITPITDFTVTINTTITPEKITMKSPDFEETRTLDFQLTDSALIISVDSLEYYDVIIIE